MSLEGKNEFKLYMLRGVLWGLGFGWGMERSIADPQKTLYFVVTVSCDGVKNSQVPFLAFSALAGPLIKTAW